MLNADKEDGDHESRPTSDRDHENRIARIYVIALYGSVIVTLVCLYLAATMLADLSPIAALSVVGLLGVLALATMLSATLRNLRNSEREAKDLREHPRVFRRLIWRALPAAGFSLLSGAMAVYGHFVAASLFAFLAVAALRYVPWKTPR